MSKESLAKYYQKNKELLKKKQRDNYAKNFFGHPQFNSLLLLLGW